MSGLLLDFLRHGEPEGGRRYRGSGCDDPLSPAGWAQMRAALGNACPWDGVVSSPLGRCRAFAAALAEDHGLPLVVDPRLRELGMGAWEGLTPEAVRARDPEGLARYYEAPEHGRPPGGETLAALGRRVGEAVEELREAQPGRHLLVVAHAGVMRALLGWVLQAPADRWYRARVDYAGITRVAYRHGGWSLEFHNRRRLGQAPCLNLQARFEHGSPIS